MLAVVTKRVLAFVCLASALLAVAPAGAGSSAGKQYRYRVIAATHSSSSKKSDLPFYTGSSTATWQLAPATQRAPNVIGVTLAGNPYPITQGLGTVNVSGVYTLDATDRKYGHCQLSAPTGSTEYPAVAPAAFALAIGQDPKVANRAIVGIPYAVYATLGAPYGQCATSLTGQPDPDTTSLTSIPKSVFGRATVTIEFAGQTSSHGIDYTWSTTIKLKLIKRKR
jgi:hypothetical protein